MLATDAVLVVQHNSYTTGAGRLGSNQFREEGIDPAGTTGSPVWHLLVGVFVEVGVKLFVAL